MTVRVMLVNKDVVKRVDEVVRRDMILSVYGDLYVCWGFTKNKDTASRVSLIDDVLAALVSFSTEA